MQLPVTTHSNLSAPRSHRCRVSLQDQPLGSPHLLLFHLPADGLFGLVRQLTAGGQAGIPHHLLNTPANTQKKKHGANVILHS